MRVLVLGGDGMLGHQLVRRLAASHEVRATLRRGLDEYAKFALFDGQNSYPGVTAAGDGVARAVDDFRPEVVVNCIGIVKQLAAAHEAIPSIEVNALFPHRIAEICGRANARFIHLSTDCVFSGRQGMYREDDLPDPVDLYGHTKLLGEVSYPGCLTLRTSIVGPELSRKTGLYEWFVSQRGRRIRGFRRAIFSGLSTLEMSRVIDLVVSSFPDASGLFHVSSEPINKYELLQLLNQALGTAVEIEPDDSFECDRSLDSSRFRETLSYVPPTWSAMAKEMAAGTAATRP